MSLQSIKDSITFWSSNNWNATLYNHPPLPVSTTNISTVMSWVDQVYASAYGRALLERAEVSGNLRIAEVAQRGAYAYPLSADPWVGINFADMSKIYWINEQGQFVQADADLILVHELSHLEEADDPNNGSLPTDAQQNDAAWDFAGGAVEAQNTVARETGRSSETRVSYFSSIFDDNPLFNQLKTGVSYTNNQQIDIARFGSDAINNQDHTARLDSADLILGFGGDDYIHGGGGNDHLYGGQGNDTIYGGLGNDSVYGEAGNDTLAGNVGVDLLHGGYNRAVDTSSVLNNDGTDEASYDVFLPVSSGLGVEIRLGGAAMDQSYSHLSDFGNAVFVKDLARDGAIDTLISIEKIIGTSSDDRLVITDFNASGLAGADGRGGLAQIDFSGQPGGSSAGDLIDAQALNTGIRVDLTTGRLESIADATISLTVINVERIIGGDGDDELTGDDQDNVLTGGDGADTLSGGGGDDKLYGGHGDVLTGGEGADIFYLSSDLVDYGPYFWKPSVTITDLDDEDRIYIDGKLLSGASVSATGDYYGDPNIEDHMYDSISESYSWLEGSSFLQNTKNGEEIYSFYEGQGTIYLESGSYDEEGYLSVLNKGINININSLSSAAGGISYQYSVDSLFDSKFVSYYGYDEFNV